MPTCPHLRGFAIGTAYSTVASRSMAQLQREAMDKARFDPQLATLLQTGQYVVTPEVSLADVQAELAAEPMASLSLCNEEDCGHWNHEEDCCGQALG